MNRTQLRTFVATITLLPLAALAGGPPDQSVNETLLAAADSAIPADARPAIQAADEDRAAPVGTEFTYQGLLGDGGSPADGQYDMQFTLTDELGVVVAGPICIDNVNCVDGLFTVSLDFGALFDGGARELAISVRTGGVLGNCASPIGYIPLAPRQTLKATPYALGLRLPYKGAASADGSVFEVVNNNSIFGNDWAIRGMSGGNANFQTFGDSAGVRGDGVGASVAGVLGVSDGYAGVVGYTAGGGYGVVGRADGAGGTGVKGLGPGITTGWAGFFEGRGYFAGNVGIGAVFPSAQLDVVGKVKTEQLQVTSGAVAGKVLTSDGSGNATWQPAPAPSVPTAFATGFGNNPTATMQFLTPTVTVTITSGQSIFVTANKAFGSVAAGGADDLNLYVGYRLVGSGATPSTLGGGIFGNRVPQNTRITMGISGIIAGLFAGTYEVGMVGNDDGTGNWNWNEYGYVTAIVLN